MNKIWNFMTGKSEQADKTATEGQANWATEQLNEESSGNRNDIASQDTELSQPSPAGSSDSVSERANESEPAEVAAQENHSDGKSGDYKGDNKNVNDQGVSNESGDVENLQQNVVEAIRTCYDPEIPVNIYELGLIYNIAINPDSKHVDVDMTLTSPMCPVAGTLPLEVEEKVRSVGGVASARVDVVWDPPWTPEMMSEAAKLDLGFDL